MNKKDMKQKIGKLEDIIAINNTIIECQYKIIDNTDILLSYLYTIHNIKEIVITNEIYQTHRNKHLTIKSDEVPTKTYYFEKEGEKNGK